MEGAWFNYSKKVDFRNYKLKTARYFRPGQEEFLLLENIMRYDWENYIDYHLEHNVIVAFDRGDSCFIVYRPITKLKMIRRKK